MMPEKTQHPLSPTSKLEQLIILPSPLTTRQILKADIPLKSPMLQQPASAPFRRLSSQSSLQAGQHPRAFQLSQVVPGRQRAMYPGYPFLLPPLGLEAEP
jgi:hypothetical protein